MSLGPLFNPSHMDLGNEPIVHLWHKAQPLKNQDFNPNLDRLQERLNVPTETRILQLRQPHNIP